MTGRMCIVFMLIACFAVAGLSKKIPTSKNYYTIKDNVKLYDRENGVVVAVFPKYFSLYFLKSGDAEWVRLSSGYWIRPADFVEYPHPNLIEAIKGFSGQYVEKERTNVSLFLSGADVAMISQGENYLQKIFYFRGRPVEFTGDCNGGEVKVFGRNVYPRAEFPQEMMGKNSREFIRRDGTFDFNGNALFTINLQRINEREILVNGIRFQLVQKWN